MKRGLNAEYLMTYQMDLRWAHYWEFTVINYKSQEMWHTEL